jgi:hypothetical protein
VVPSLYSWFVTQKIDNCALVGSKVGAQPLFESAASRRTITVIEKGRGFDLRRNVCFERARLQAAP